MNPQPGEPACRVCGSRKVSVAGVVEYFAGFAFPVSDCGSCGCRFTRHDSAVYDLLHESGAIYYYLNYREMAAEAGRLYRRGDLPGLARFLSTSTKHRFILEEAAKSSAGARLLEVGCSRGYLTSYFILSGRDVLGIDVSADAVEGARAEFGDHFALPGSDLVRDRAPYDIIYHAGMIGCVADPIALTRQLLNLLKPGGRLLFNAPCREALRSPDQLWFDSAPPPDLVTLYPRGFWRQQFAQLADVREGVEHIAAAESFACSLRALFRRRWRPPRPQAMDGAVPYMPDYKDSGPVWSVFERGMRMVARVTGLSKWSKRRPSEYGLFVIMKSREAGAAALEDNKRVQH